MEKEQPKKTLGISALLYSYGKAIRSYWWVVIIFCILFSLLSFSMSLNPKPQYLASCTMTVKTVNHSVTESLNSQYSIYYDKDLAEQLEKTFSDILASDHLTDHVERKLGEAPKSSLIKASCIKGSNMFELHAKADTPEQALSMLNAVLEAFPDAARYVVGDLSVDIVETPQVKEDPSNTPNMKRILLSGVAIGFIVGSVVLILFVRSQRTVQKPEELEKLVNMPCLGVIPGYRPESGIHYGEQTRPGFFGHQYFARRR